jgi:hypothetical protein
VVLKQKKTIKVFGGKKVTMFNYQTNSQGSEYTGVEICVPLYKNVFVLNAYNSLGEPSSAVLSVLTKMISTLKLK